MVISFQLRVISQDMSPRMTMPNNLQTMDFTQALDRVSNAIHSPFLIRDHAVFFLENYMQFFSLDIVGFAAAKNRMPHDFPAQIVTRKEIQENF